MYFIIFPKFVGNKLIRASGVGRGLQNPGLKLCTAVPLRGAYYTKIQSAFVEILLVLYEVQYYLKWEA